MAPIAYRSPNSYEPNPYSQTGPHGFRPNAPTPAWLAREMGMGSPSPAAPPERPAVSDADAAFLTNFRADQAANPRPFHSGVPSALTPEEAEKMTAYELSAEAGRRRSLRLRDLNNNSRYQDAVRAGQIADQTPGMDAPQFAVENRYKEDPRVAEIRRRKLIEADERHWESRDRERANRGLTTRAEVAAIRAADRDMRRMQMGGFPIESIPAWMQAQMAHQRGMQGDRFGHESQMQEGRFGHESSMQDDRQRYEGEQAGLNRDFMGREKGLDRDFQRGMQSDRFEAERRNNALGTLPGLVGAISSNPLAPPDVGLNLNMGMLNEMMRLGGLDVPSLGALNLGGESGSGGSAGGRMAQQLVAQAAAKLRQNGQPITNASLMKMIPLDQARAIAEAGGRGDLQAAMVGVTNDVNFQDEGRGWFGAESGMAPYRDVYLGPGSSGWGNGGFLTDWFYSPNQIGEASPRMQPAPPPSPFPLIPVRRGGIVQSQLPPRQ